MKKSLWILAFLLLLGGCGAKTMPEWTRTSFSRLESFKMHYLRGNERLAALNFRKAIDEIKTSGDIRIMGKAYLTKYALRTAALENFDDSEYLRWEDIRQTSENIHYYYFLKGAFPQVDIRELPVQYRRVLQASQIGSQGDIDREVSAIGDPLSRLIAAGLMVQRKQGSESILSMAVQTASEQGWKKPLLAYLKKLQIYYDEKEERHKSASIRQHIELINE